MLGVPALSNVPEVMASQAPRLARARATADIRASVSAADTRAAQPRNRRRNVERRDAKVWESYNIFYIMIHYLLPVMLILHLEIGYKVLLTGPY